MWEVEKGGGEGSRLVLNPWPLYVYVAVPSNTRRTPSLPRLLLDPGALPFADLAGQYLLTLKVNTTVLLPCYKIAHPDEPYEEELFQRIRKRIEHTASQTHFPAYLDPTEPPEGRLRGKSKGKTPVRGTKNIRHWSYRLIPSEATGGGGGY